MSDRPSYHDTVVYVNGVAHRIADNYGYELTCVRAAGWQLWFTRQYGEPPALLGGEYDGMPFRIEVRGVVVCDNGKALPDAPPSQG